jgi:hypothetical protein
MNYGWEAYFIRIAKEIPPWEKGAFCGVVRGSKGD